MSNPIQNRGVVTQWTYKAEGGAITPITTAAAVPATLAKNRIIDSITFYNPTGGTITATLYHKSAADVAPGNSFGLFSLATTVTLPIPVAHFPLYLPAGEDLYMLASATGLHYVINYRVEK